MRAALAFLVKSGSPVFQWRPCHIGSNVRDLYTVLQISESQQRFLMKALAHISARTLRGNLNTDILRVPICAVSPKEDNTFNKKKTHTHI